MINAPVDAPETVGPNQSPLITVNEAMLAYARSNRPMAEAVVIDTIGSPPVPIGGRMVIAGEDEFHGSVSGGCVEADVIAASLDVIAGGKPQILTFGIADSIAWRAGLACGSTIRVAILPLPRSDAERIAEVHSSAERDRQTRIVLTNLSTGARRIPTIGERLPAEAVAALDLGQSCVFGSEDTQSFAHIIQSAPRLVLIGATQVAQALAAMAKACGYAVLVIDPRSAFTSTARFDAETAITGWPEQTLANLVTDTRTAIVTLTHIGHIDDEALKIAVQAPCRYIGALGSRKTHAARVARLKAEGLSDAEMARIHAPVGMDLGGRTPGEIAVAILAEIVAAFNGKLPS